MAKLTSIMNLIRSNPLGVDIYAKDHEAAEIFTALQDGDLITYPGRGIFWFKTEGASEALIYRMWGDGVFRTYQVRGYQDFFTVQWLAGKGKLEIKWTTTSTRRVNPWDLIQVAGPVVGTPAPLVPDQLSPSDIKGENVGNGTGLVYKDTQSGVLKFRKLRGSSGVTITTTGDDVTIDASFAAGAGEEREQISVDLDIATRKWIDLLHVPNPPRIQLTVKGGPDQFQGADFALTSNGTDVRRVTWSGYGLNDLIAAGDKIEIEYNY